MFGHKIQCLCKLPSVFFMSQKIIEISFLDRTFYLPVRHQVKSCFISIKKQKISQVIDSFVILSSAEGGNLRTKDRKLKDFLSDSRLYADLWNGGVFAGRQFVQAEELEEINPILLKVDQRQDNERLRDIVMKESRKGLRFVVWALENQESVDYSMPVRVMLEEALAYDKQVKKIIARNNAMAEQLETLDFGEAKMREDIEYIEALKQLIPEMPLHIINASKIENTEQFRTELKPFFERYSRRNDKEAFAQYLQEEDVDSRMNEQSWQTLIDLMQSKKLKKLIDLKKTYNHEGKEVERPVCKALEDYYNDAKMEGKSEGIREGITVFVKDYLEEGKTLDAIKGKLIYRFGLTEPEALKYLEQANT